MVADYLNRNENRKQAIEGDDGFSNSGILHISACDAEVDKSLCNDKWLEDMSHLLSTSLPPPQMRTDEKKRLAVRSRNFCLLEGTWYHKGRQPLAKVCSK